MLRTLAALTFLTLAGCGDDELDRVDGGMEVAPAPSVSDVDLEDGLDGDLGTEPVYEVNTEEALDGAPLPPPADDDLED